jgi:hypothetical protein
MVLLGLLLVALACLVLGLVTAGGIWFVASLVASALAGYLLWRQREQIAARTGEHKDQSAPKTSARPTSLVTGTAFSAKPNADAPAASGTSAASATQDVWVVDGKPQFHTKACGEIAGDAAEAIPFSQAVEDGFTECAACKPAVSSSRTPQVWVVDGRPDYHADGCRTLRTAAAQSETEAEQIPRAQALEDGFTPCPDCRPDGAAPASTTPIDSTASDASEAAPAGTVWVVDGRPRYHLQDCLTIKGQQAEAIPVEQAAEDGFMPCSMCEPAVTRV